MKFSWHESSTNITLTSGICDPTNGQCPCENEDIVGRKCDQCKVYCDDDKPQQWCNKRLQWCHIEHVSQNFSSEFQH